MQGLTAVSPAWSQRAEVVENWRRLADVELGLRRCTAALGRSGEVPAQVLVRAEEGDAEELVGAPGGLGEQQVA